MAACAAATSLGAKRVASIAVAVARPLTVVASRPLTVAVGPYNHGLSGLGKRAPPSRDAPTRARVDRRATDERRGGCGEADELLFGIHPVVMALKSGRRTPRQLFVRDALLQKLSNSGEETVQQAAVAPDRVQTIVSLAQERGVRVTPTDRDQLDSLSCQRPHQGVCLLASRLSYIDFSSESVPPAVDDTRHLWLMLNSVKDPMNFGAILRTAYFMGVDRVLTSRTDRCPLSPVVSKASAGAMEAMQLYTCDMIQTIKHMVAKGWSVVGAAPNSAMATDLSRTVLRGSTALVVGNEGAGLDQQVMDLCTHKVLVAGREPKTDVDSLNVSVATAIIIHHLLLRGDPVEGQWRVGGSAGCLSRDVTATASGSRSSART